MDLFVFSNKRKSLKKADRFINFQKLKLLNITQESCRKQETVLHVYKFNYITACK